MKLSFNNSTSGPKTISPTDISKDATSGTWGFLSGSDAYHASSDASLFSSSLPVLAHERLNLNNNEKHYPSVDDIASGLNKSNQEFSNPLEEVGSRAIGNLLPDDEDELLAGIMDDLDLSGLPNSLDDLEDYDVFGSGGGMELDTDPLNNISKGLMKMKFYDGSVDNGLPQFGYQNGTGAVVGEHPHGEHPSRTLFVRNINSNVEDLELRALFEQYGDIRTLYTACKHRGFVMISYYDIRAARAAMRALQNKPLRRRKLDIHFSIPKDNPTEKDINQGTLVVFNLDPSVSNEDLKKIFGAYGEIKEIRETPYKKHHKFVEFFDVRAAEAALKGLNRSDIAGKRIKLEPSRPGGARRNLMMQLNQELDQDDLSGFLHHVGSPVASASPGNWLNSPIDRSPFQSISKSPVLPGLASLLHSQGSNSAKVAPIGKDRGTPNRLEHLFSSDNVSGDGAHSFPDLGPYHHGTVSSLGSSNSNAARLETLSGSQFLWGRLNPQSFGANPLTSNGKVHSFPFPVQHGSLPHYQHHHVGSAPSGFFPKSSEAALMGHAAFGGTSGHMSSGAIIPTNMSEMGSSSFRYMASPRLSPVFFGNGSFPRSMNTVTNAMDGFLEHGRGRRVESNMNQVESKKQFQLDLDKIISGEDARTTLMIKNIPNKYTSKMLLAAIDEKNKGTYDFIYLPIDFKNKCNVGYAFINMLSSKHIIPFFEAFDGKKWEKFNSEKVASLAYARIQGKAALIAHFQNSSLMNEDKRCRPIVFDGPESADQEPLQSNNMILPVSQPNILQTQNHPENCTNDVGSKKAEQS